MQRPEFPTDPQIPAEDFSEQALRFSLNNAAMPTLKVLGLQSHQGTPDFDAILAMLGTRYGYWTDDLSTTTCSDGPTRFGYPSTQTPCPHHGP